MLFRHKTIEDVSHGLITLRQAADSYMTPVLAEEKTHLFPSTKTEINASDIQTQLIQITGRFCERHASDLVCTLSDLDPFLQINGIPEKDDRWIIGIGIRDCGVDGNTFLYNRLKNTVQNFMDYVYPSTIYRKVLCIDIQDTKDPACRKIQLKDLTHTISKLSPEDKNYEGA